MVVRIRKLGSSGHDTFNLTLDEAQAMVDVDVGRYFVIDEETTKLVSEVKLKDGQKIMMVPIVQGG
jgi:hypothetical protein